MDKFDLIRTFVTICENGSVTGAADELGLDPSRVSQRLKSLENSLGVSLIQRTTRTMSMTDAGRSYLEFGRETISRVDVFEARLKQESQSMTGMIRISAPPYFADRLMGTILEELSQRFQSLKFDLRSDADTVDLLADNIDIAIRAGQMPDSQLMSRTLFSGQQRLYAAQSYIDRNGAPDTPDDLKQHPLLVFRGHRMHRSWYFEKDGRRWIHRTDPEIVSSNLKPLLDLVTAGKGIVRLSDWVPIISEITDALVIILPEYQSGQSRLSLVYPREASRRRASNEVLTQIHSILKRLLANKASVL